MVRQLDEDGLHDLRLDGQDDQVGLVDCLGILFTNRNSKEFLDEIQSIFSKVRGHDVFRSGCAAVKEALYHGFSHITRTNESDLFSLKHLRILWNEFRSTSNRKGGLLSSVGKGSRACGHYFSMPLRAAMPLSK